MAQIELGDIPGFIAMFADAYRLFKSGTSPAAAIQQTMKQQMPHMFGIGQADERMMKALVQLMTEPRRRYISLVIGAMLKFESDLFRLRVTGMPCGSKEIDDRPISNPQGGQPPTTPKKIVLLQFTEDDLRVKYLNEVADEVAAKLPRLSEQAAAEEVVAEMRARHELDKIAFVKWLEQWVGEFFDVETLEEITPETFETRILVARKKLAQKHPSSLTWNKDTHEMERHLPGLWTIFAQEIGLAWLWRFIKTRFAKRSQEASEEQGTSRGDPNV